IGASCHGSTSAGKSRPLSGVVKVGETTATVGIANSLVSALAICRCRNCGTKPPTQAIKSSAPPESRIKRCPLRTRVGSVLCSSEPGPTLLGSVVLIYQKFLTCGDRLSEVG